MMQARSFRRELSLSLALALGGAVLLAQSPATPPQSPKQPPVSKPPSGQEGVLTQQAPREIIRRTVDLVTTSVIVRKDNQFVADLSKKDFEVYEDGVKQEINTFVLTHGGQVIHDVDAAPPPLQEGILLPPPKPTNDASGRVFLIFVDDLHMEFRNTSRIRDLFKKMERELIHEGDMFAIVSSGPSSIAEDMTYDRKRLDEAISKIAGSELSPSDIIETPDGSQGPPEVRYRAHVAFSTAYDVLTRFEQIHNRRKAFIYVSDGYDYDPYKKARTAAAAERAGATCTDPTDPNSCSNPNSSTNGDSTSAIPDTNPFSQDGNEFAAADLAAELSELTREANRANTTIYTIDPRGLTGGPDLDVKVDPVEWQDHIRETQNSLRVIADLTGGIAVVNQNDFDKALKRIDGETSDYYLLGYYSTNPDPTKKRRSVEVRVTRPGKFELHYTPQYTLKPPPAVKVNKK